MMNVDERTKALMKTRALAALQPREPELDWPEPTSGAKGNKKPDSRLRSDLRATASQGVLMGFSDEMNAAAGVPVEMIRNYSSGVGPTSFGEVYDQNLALQRNILDATRNARPILAPATEIVGALATGKVPVGLALKGGNAIEKTVRAGGIGGLYGGIAGFGSGEGGFVNRVKKSALPAGAIGLGLGAGAPWVAKGIAHGWNKAATRLADYGVEAKSLNAILRQLGASGIGPRKLEERLAPLGDEGMLADVTKDMQKLNAATALADSEAARKIGGRLEARRAGGPMRDDRMLHDAFGSPVAHPLQPHSRQRAFDQGRLEVIGEGPGTMLPETLDDLIRRGSEVQNFMREQGVRAELSRLLKNARAQPDSPFDNVLGRNQNAQKMEIMRGPKGKRLASGLEGEQIFDETLRTAKPFYATTPQGIARSAWGVGARPGVLPDMLAAGGATAITTGSPSAGIIAGLGVGASDLVRRMAGKALVGKPTKVIRSTADKLTATGPEQERSIRALIDKADEPLERAKIAANLEKVGRALLLRQVGPAVSLYNEAGSR